MAMIEETVQTITSEIGRRIRDCRRGAGRTLADVAGMAELSEGFLSKLERGQAACSIANLIQLCAALELNIADLFAGRDLAARTRLKVHRAMSGTLGTGLEEIQSTGYRFRHLAGGSMRDELEVFHLVFPTKNGMETLVSHLGQEHCYVLSGEIEFVVAGETHILAEGDGILIDSSQPHLARNVGGSPAQVLMTVTKIDHGGDNHDWWRAPSTAARDRQIIPNRM